MKHHIRHCDHIFRAEFPLQYRIRRITNTSTEPSWHKESYENQHNAYNNYNVNECVTSSLYLSRNPFSILMYFFYFYLLLAFKNFSPSPIVLIITTFKQKMTFLHVYMLRQRYLLSVMSHRYMMYMLHVPHIFYILLLLYQVNYFVADIHRVLYRYDVIPKCTSHESWRNISTCKAMFIIFPVIFWGLRLSGYIPV